MVQLTEDAPEFSVIVYMAGVKVVTNGALEESRVLGNDGQSASEIEQADRGCVDIVNADVARRRLDQAEQGECEGGLACACAADHADLLVRLDIKVDVLENQVQAFPVPGAVVDKVNLALGGPRDGGSVLGDDLGRFTGQSRILENTLHRHDVGLDLDGLADDPVERGGDLQGI